VAKARSRRQVRTRLDWVQNPQCYNIQATQVDNTPGVNSVAGILVHSKQIGLQDYGNATIFGTWQNAAFPNNKKVQVVRRVVGEFFVRPLQSWSAGSARYMGFRIGKFVENPETADIVVPPDYAMMEDVEPTQGPYVWADKRFLWEHRMYGFFNGSWEAAGATPWWKIRVDWRGREFLENDECLAFYFENALQLQEGLPGGPVYLGSWLRTLCEVTPS